MYAVFGSSTSPEDSEMASKDVPCKRRSYIAFRVSLTSSPAASCLHLLAVQRQTKHSIRPNEGMAHPMFALALHKLVCCPTFGDSKAGKTEHTTERKNGAPYACI